LYTVATRVGANRIVRGGKFHHPFGDPALPPAEEYVWRRQFVERTIQALCTPVQAPTVFDVEMATVV
jgi:glycine/betaine/sarcosine/D-proline reductase family selenoprotein B